MDNCVLSGNTVKNTSYSVVSLNYAYSTISNSTFENNNCPSVIDVNYNADPSKAVVTVSGCEFVANSCSGAGVIYKNAGNVEVINSVFTNNSVSTNGNAAVVYTGWGSGDKVVGCTFEGNSVTTSHATTKRFASAIFCDGCTVSDNVFINNTAVRNGETINTVVAVGAYYGEANISGNYWGGNAPVPGVDYTVEFTLNNVAVESYYADASLTNEVTINYAAKVGKYSYVSLQDAFNAAVSGDTITLLGNVALSKYLDIYTANNGEVARELTLDLNGNSIYAADDYKVSDYPLVFIGINQTLTIKNSVNAYARSFAAGTIYAPSGVTVGVYGTLNLEGGRIENGGNSEDDAAIAVWNWDNGPGYADVAIGTANINGGNVVGGLFNEGSLAVNGGTIDKLTVAMGDAAISGDATIGSIEAQASIGSVYYPTLEDAINAAQSGDIITLLESVELASLVFDKSVNINGQNVYSITAAISITADNIQVSLINLDIIGVAGNSAVISMTANAKLIVSSCTITAKGDNQYILLAEGVTNAYASIDADLTLVNGEVLKADADDITCYFKAEYADELAARGYVVKAVDGNMIVVTGSVPYYIGADGYWYFNGEKTEYVAVGTNGISPEIKEENGVKYWFVGDYNTGVKAEAVNGLTPEIKDVEGVKYWFIGDKNTGIKAEGIDAPTPEVKEVDGVKYWFVGDFNTGVKAEAVDGIDGLTPEIKEVDGVKYWFIGDDNTGIKAEGIDGSDGLTPEIKEVDGVKYWFIGDENTGVKAEAINGVNGLTPEIKVVDGVKYWFIGDENTGVKAEGIDAIAPEIKEVEGVKYWFINNENTWVKAEGIDAEAPTIQEVDGVKYWFIGETNTWVKAEGIDGKTPSFKIEDGYLFYSFGDDNWTKLDYNLTGLTPEIKEVNGVKYWFIGETNTWVKAEGIDGKTPEIREVDGVKYWFIGDDNTGVKAEGIDGKTPSFKLEDGHLFVSYDGTNWTDLGKVAGEDGKPGENGKPGVDGKPGEDGKTPYIGENGNWWIGETDTGIKAEGEDGAAGQTPYIGENGNWWIGETDTGVKAAGTDGADGTDGKDYTNSQEIILISIAIAAVCIITAIIAIVTRKPKRPWWILT